MISNQTALASIGLSSILASKGLSVAAVSGTPVANLVSLTNNVTACMPTCTPVVSEETISIQDSLISTANSLAIYTVGEDGIASGHDRALDAYVETISRAVCSHVSFAKNIVAPVVLDMVAKVQKKMQVAHLPSSELGIELIELPLPMQNTGFEDAVGKYEGKPRLLPETELNLEVITLEDMVELMKTGSKDYDLSVSQWFASKPESFFSTIWDNLFRDFKKSNPSIVVKIEDIVTDKVTGVDAALAIHLLARKLYDEVPESTGMTLEQYKEIVSQYRDYTGAVLFAAYTQYNLTIRNNLLVSGIAPDRKTIRVNGAVYRDWLTKGGSNEILLGMLVSDDIIFTANLITDQAQKYLSQWTTYEQYTGVLARNNAFSTFRENLIIEFAESMRHVSELETSTFNAKPDILNNIENYFKEQMQHVFTKDMDDVNEVCLRLVCRSRFFYTDAEKILRGINEAAKANPGIDVKQAALLSTIEYVADYVSNQFQLV